MNFKFLTILLLGSILFFCCIGDKKNDDVSQSESISNKFETDQKIKTISTPIEIPLKEDWVLESEYTIEGIEPFGIASFFSFVFVTDTANQIVKRYNTLDNTSVQVSDSKVGYIQQRVNRLFMPMMDLDSIFVYRGEPTLFRFPISRELNKPMSFDAYRIDDYVISDGGNDRVIRFLNDIEIIIGERGSGEGQFINPEGVHFANARFYVADTGNKRIQSFSNEGEYMSTIAGNGLNAVSSISSDGKYLFVLDNLDNDIHVYTPVGDLLYTLTDYFMEPTDIYFNQGKLYIADKKGATVKVLTNKKYTS